MRVTLAVDLDAFGRGVGGSGQGPHPGAMGLVADSDPVDGTQDDGGARAEQDDAACPQRIIDAADRLDPAAAEGMARGRSRVRGERSNVQGRHGLSPRVLRPPRESFVPAGG